VDRFQRSSSGSGVSRTHYAARVHYAYEVDGRRFESDRIGLVSGSSSDPSGARETVARYSKGATVTAYVNQEDPSDALLEPGIAPWLLIAFGAAAILWLAIWELVAWAVNKSRKNPPPAQRTGWPSGV
jgi:hypothetical protein